MPLRADYGSREGDRPRCAIHLAAAVVAPHEADGVELTATGERAMAYTHQRKDDWMWDGVSVEQRDMSYPSATHSPGVTRLHGRRCEHRHSAHRAVSQVWWVDARS
jgi:hypothetical protein